MENERQIKEVTLPIQVNGQWKNISLKQKWDEGTLVREGLGDGDYIIVTKGDYAEGKEFNGKFGLSYTCRVIYNDEEVSFFLNEKEHDRFKEVGAGEKMKIINLKETYVLNGQKKSKNVFNFEQVE